MKKLISLFAVITALVACSKADVTVPETEEPQGTEVKFNITVGDFDSQTKAIKTGWTNGDRINIWFDGISNYAATPDLILTYDGTAWNPGSLNKTPNANGNIIVLYEGFNDISHYQHTSQYLYPNTTLTVENMGCYAQPMAYTNGSNISYTFESNTLTANINDWKSLTPFQIVVKGLDSSKASAFALNCDNMRSGALSITNANNGFEKLSQTRGSYTLGISNSDGVAFYFTEATQFPPYITPDWKFILYDSETGLKWAFTAKGKTLTADSRKCQGISINFSKFALDPDTYAVDMGLHSGVKWAIFNVGATKLQENGDYFAWGETVAKKRYTWSTYSDNPSGDGRTFIKYKMDGKTILDPEDDAATVNWGNGWRMPTRSDYQELFAENDDIRWTSNYKNTGASGYIVYSRNGNSIFFPATGTYDDTSHYTVINSYWCSTLLDSEGAQCFVFYELENRWFDTPNHRYVGQPVRAVYSASPSNDMHY